MDRRPFDGLKVENEDLDGLGQKSCDGLEAIELVVGRPWEFDTWRGDKTTASKSSDGLEASRSLELQPECMARRCARKALATSAQNRHPSYQALVSWATTCQDREDGPRRA